VGWKICPVEVAFGSKYHQYRDECHWFEVRKRASGPGLEAIANTIQETIRVWQDWMNPC
jgi:hypothetical protein